MAATLFKYTCMAITEFYYNSFTIDIVCDLSSLCFLSQLGVILEMNGVDQKLIRAGMEAERMCLRPTNGRQVAL